jgi:cysteine synthase A
VQDVGELIGSTPLVRLAGPSDATGALVLGKLEAQNPSGSLKDRAVAAMLAAAQGAGRAAPGAPAIVASAGNTGLSLAVLAPLFGRAAVVAAPASAPLEWRRLVAGLGAELLLTAPAEGMGGAIRRAQAESRARPGSVLLSPFTDAAAPAAYAALADELWRDLDGRLDVVVAGVGTGATAGGLARALGPRGVRVVGVEPAEAPNLTGRGGGVHRIAGIGAGFAPAHWQASGIGESEAVASAEAIAECRRLAMQEGLLVGPSAGAAAVASRRVARAGQVVVAILADGGERYLAQPGFLADEAQA